MNLLQVKTKSQFLYLIRSRETFLDSINSKEHIVIDHKNNQNVDFKILENTIAIEKFYIEKRNANLGYRTIHKALSHELEFCQKILNSELSKIYKPLECVQGFVFKKNIKTNAFVHLSQKQILTLDIKNFFESITQNQIIESLNKLGVNNNVSEWISNIACVNGFLVQGFSTSPILANIVALEMDLDILENIDKTINYTRYADDLYFSSNSNSLNLQVLTTIINKYGFELNESKTKLMKRGQKQYVTGLSVFDSNFPRIPKKIKRELRLEAYYIKKYGYEEHIIKKLKIKKYQLKNPEIRDLIMIEVIINRDRIYGWLHFINSIEPNFSKKIIEELKKTSANSGLQKLGF
ncbi:reverse transcriptase family protein [Flavobacterium sp.]|uniref:reverse transcriptase family protein n=1 Tax=Flavobacterium sp. TaxID=239 RepID=UPI003753B739